MPKYLVESGGICEVFEAPDHEAACVAAVKAATESDDPPELGEIMQVIEVAEDSVSYFSTECACKRAGCWAPDNIAAYEAAQKGTAAP